MGAVYAFFAYAVAAHIAEDLTSATFERVLRSWDSFDPERGSERTWILTISRNLLTDHYRRQRTRDAISTDEYPALLERLTSTEHPLAAALRVEGLASWLQHLGPREREVLALRYGADLSATDIAEVLDLTAANVHQICSRSLRRLRQIADDESISDSAAPSA